MDGDGAWPTEPYFMTLESVDCMCSGCAHNRTFSSLKPARRSVFVFTMSSMLFAAPKPPLFAGNSAVSMLASRTNPSPLLFMMSLSGTTTPKRIGPHARIALPMLIALRISTSPPLVSSEPGGSMSTSSGSSASHVWSKYVFTLSVSDAADSSGAILEPVMCSPTTAAFPVSVR
eukprot:6212075-Pleurochrysis_carterae.AAC.7